MRECVYGEKIFCVCIVCVCTQLKKKRFFFIVYIVARIIEIKTVFCVHFWMKAIYKSHFQWQICTSHRCGNGFEIDLYEPVLRLGPISILWKRIFYARCCMADSFFVSLKRCDDSKRFCCTSIGFNRFSMTMKRMFCHFLCDSGEEISIIYGRFCHRSPSIAGRSAASFVLWIAL